jgi:hypothetical protein
MQYAEGSRQAIRTLAIVSGLGEQPNHQFKGWHDGRSMKPPGLLPSLRQPAQKRSTSPQRGPDDDHSCRRVKLVK